jgi:hypothetical protein
MYAHWLGGVGVGSGHHAPARTGRIRRELPRFQVSARLSEADIIPDCASSAFARGKPCTPWQAVASHEVRHDFRGEQFERLGVVLERTADQQVNARLGILADQVSGLPHCPGKAAEMRCRPQPLSLRA